MSSFVMKSLEIGHSLFPWKPINKECLARKHDKSGTFSYYFLLILSHFNADDSETWQKYAVGRNHLKLKKN